MGWMWGRGRDAGAGPPGTAVRWAAAETAGCMLTAPGALALLPRAAGCGLAILMWPRRATCSLCARVLPGHAVEGNAALRRLPLPCQLRSREPGLSSWARTPHLPPLEAGPTTARRPALSPLRRSPRCPQVQKQETWGFPAYGMGVGLWIMISSLPRRRLVLNHTCGTYYFSIQGHTVCQGPMHLIYVRLARSSDGDARGSGGRGEGVQGKGTLLGSREGRASRPAAPPRTPPPGATRLMSRVPLASLRKVLLPAGSVRPQTGASGAGTSVRALRGGSRPGPPQAQTGCSPLLSSTG